MKKTLLNKKTIILFFLSVLMVFSVGFFTYANASADASLTPKTIDEVAYTMEDGASIRMSSDNKTNGLRFVASMPTTDYEALKANTNYSNLIFGVVIAPADYLVSEEESVDKGFTEENLFSDNAIYAWDEYVNGEWVYDAEANVGKTRIINITASVLDTTKIADKAVITASITNLYDNNIARDFIARGYIIAEIEGADNNYALASYYQNDIDNNVRSMAVVAEKAVADTSEYAIDDEQKDWCTENYLELDGVYNDLTANPVKLNNYAENGNKVDVASFGTVNHITDGQGNYLPFTQNGETLTLDISGIDESEELCVTVYTLNNGSYKLNKVKISVDVKIKITNATEFNAMRSATSGEYVLMNDITLTEALSAPTATFNATLDGNGKTINGVTINGAFGIFSTIGTNAVVKNLLIENATLGGVQTGVVATFLSAGATLDNIYVSASIKAGNHSGGLVKQVYGSETLQTKVTNCVVNITDDRWVASNGALFAFGSAVADVDLTGTYAFSTVSSATLVGNRGDSYATFRDKINALNTTATPKLFASVEKFFANVSLKNTRIIEELGYTIVYVNNETDLNNMRKESSTSKKYYILTDDITLSSTPLEAPATNFYGVFDGNGHYIKNMHLDGTSKGLFNNLRFVVRNLALVDVVITGQAGAICYATAENGNYTAVIENVYTSVASMTALGSGALIRSQAKTNDVIRDCVVYVKQVKDSIPTYTNTYTDGSTISALQIGFVAYTGTSTVKLNNNYYISDVSNLRVFGIGKNVTYDSTTETDAVKKVKEILLQKVYTVNEFKGDNTITVKDSALLSKII